MSDLNSTVVVLKFGGTSVSSWAAWRNIADIVARHLAKDAYVVVVCSAMSQASNRLEGLAEQVGKAPFAHLWSEFVGAYETLAIELSQDLGPLRADLAALEALLAVLPKASYKQRPAQLAEIMAFGELMLTRLGASFLNDCQMQVAWSDSRAHLVSLPPETLNHDPIPYLSEQCDSSFDPALLAHYRTLSPQVVVTQGFIASNQAGETVLLGRGGSDVSAAYFAEKLGAACCEIWTDVPGIYTANPKVVPQARHLRTLDYEEAQEIALMGAKVLHPRSVAPCQRANIPLLIRYTQDPAREGTLISGQIDDAGVQIKSISSRSGLILFEIKTVNMWHQVGFLSDIFAVFSHHRLSIDLLSTSAASVTLSLDYEMAGHLTEEMIASVLEDLNVFSHARCIRDCAAVSLVGRHIRAILYQLGGIFALFESHRVYLLSQAANDLNLTFVVDAPQAAKLVKSLHALVIEQHPKAAYLSRSFESEFSDQVAGPPPWWVEKKEALLALAEAETPCYVYDQSVVVRNAKTLLGCVAIDTVFYAIKANSHPEILQVLYDQGLGFECVSIQEVDWVRSVCPDIPAHRILFTPNFASESEYIAAFALGVYVTVDNLFPLQAWPAVFAGQSVILRVDPGRGEGHHRFVITGGDRSKFGIPLDSLPAAKAALDACGAKAIGLHIHSGSGILQTDHWEKSAQVLLSALPDFPDVFIVNLGGGLGVPQKPGESPIDFSALNHYLEALKEKHPEIVFWLEPGRFLVSEAGVLLARVTQLKYKKETAFVGVDAGMNSLIRPALYGAYHGIVNLTRLEEEKTMVANVVGPICESGDTLGYGRHLPNTLSGDVLLIQHAGAYGYVMSSSYNQRPPAKEKML